jgi:AcrR family transcriptional regulator
MPDGGKLRDIVQEAARLFDQDGYSHVSMAQIAEAVGLAKPTLYHYVKSKDDILVLIHHEFMSLVLGSALDPARKPLSPNDQLKAIIGDILGLMSSHRGHVRVFFEHYRELPQRAKRSILDARNRYARHVESIVGAGVQNGEFKDVDARLATLALFGMCNWAYQWYQDSGPLSAGAIALVFSDLFLTGLQTNHSSEFPEEGRTKARTA